jgi:hypothetical protein
MPLTKGCRSPVRQGTEGTEVVEAGTAQLMEERRGEVAVISPRSRAPRQGEHGRRGDCGQRERTCVG